MNDKSLIVLSLAMALLLGCKPSPDTSDTDTSDTDSGDTDSGETGDIDEGPPFDIVKDWNVRGAIPGQPNTNDWCAQATPEDYPELEGSDCWESDDFCTSNLIFDAAGGVDWRLRINVVPCGETEPEILRATMDYGAWAYQQTLSEDTALFVGEVGDDAATGRRRRSHPAHAARWGVPRLAPA